MSLLCSVFVLFIYCLNDSGRYQDSLHLARDGRDVTKAISKVRCEFGKEIKKKKAMLDFSDLCQAEA